MLELYIILSPRREVRIKRKKNGDQNELFPLKYFPGKISGVSIKKIIIKIKVGAVSLLTRFSVLCIFREVCLMYTQLLTIFLPFQVIRQLYLTPKLLVPVLYA